MKRIAMSLCLIASCSFVFWGCNNPSNAETKSKTKITEAQTNTVVEETQSEEFLETESEIGDTQPNGGVSDEYSFNGTVISIQDGELQVELLEDCGAELKAGDEVTVFFNNGDFDEGDVVYVEFNGMVMSEDQMRLAATVLYVTE